MGRAIACAGAIMLDAHHRLLLIRRGRNPGRGQWSVPGGKCWPGESAADACVREVAEETGLVVRVVRLLGSVQRPAPNGDHFVIDDFLCTVTGGELVAGDDADEARWVDPSELAALDLVDGLPEALREWLDWPPG